MQTQNSWTHGKLHRTVLAVKPDMLKQNRTFLGFPFSLLIQTHFEVYKKKQGCFVSSLVSFLDESLAKHQSSTKCFDIL